MKKAALLSFILLFASCSILHHSENSIEPEKVHYKLFIEDNAVLSQTPVEIYVELVPTESGFMRIQQFEGPGVIIMDTLKLKPWGIPTEHIFVRGKTKTKIYYQENRALVNKDGGEFEIPYQTDFVFDIVQVDLALSRIDTLKDTLEVPFMLPESGNIAFLEVAEIRKDSIHPYFTATEKVPVSHRFGVAPGSIYEAWYIGDARLPVKMRITSSGKTYVYYHLGENPVNF